MNQFLLIFLIFILFIDFYSCQWPFKPDGIVNPPPHYERYRRNEYEDPFFQWWYFWIKDLNTDNHFAFSYTIASSEYSNTTGIFVGFAQVDKKGKTGNFKYVRYSLDSLSVTGDFDVSLPNTKNPLFSIKVLADGVYHLKGNMIGSTNTWATKGWKSDQSISWDIIYHRTYGWFGQPDFETLDEYYYGVIMWNTYSHNAEIEGSIKIGNNLFNLERSNQYRGYGDMNWGQQFPAPPSYDPVDLNYAWGWYSACDIVSNNSFDDICIIAGAGQSFTGFPLYTMVGQFADIRLGNDTHVGVRSVYVGANVTNDFHWSGTNDGKVIKFEVSRSNWINIFDEYGKATVPLIQTVQIQTSSYSISMEFFSNSWEYNRLLFPFKNYIFSDFEALGVHCKITISKNGNVIRTFSNDNCGLEFGSKFPTKMP